MKEYNCTYVLKLINEKTLKNKFWMVEIIAPIDLIMQIVKDCKSYQIGYDYINMDEYFSLNLYCYTQKDSVKAKKILKSYNAKYFENWD